MLSSWRAVGEGAARLGTAALCARKGTRFWFTRNLGPGASARLSRPQSAAVSSGKLRLESFFLHCPRCGIVPEDAAWRLSLWGTQVRWAPKLSSSTRAEISK
jgi:hypothetical protein